MDKDVEDQGVAFGPGCQPSASAASADATASSRSGIPNADRRSRVKPDGGGRQIRLSRYRSVALVPGKTRRGKRAWCVVLRNRGIESSFGLSDEAMSALLMLVERARTIDSIRAKIGTSWHVKVLDAVWEEVTASASGIVAATAGETEGLDERSEQSPVGDSRDAQSLHAMTNRTPEEIARNLTAAMKRAVLGAEEIFLGHLSVDCSDDVLYELAVDGLVDDLGGDWLTETGLAVRSHLESHDDVFRR